MKLFSIGTALSAFLFSLPVSHAAITVDFTSYDSIRAGAKVLAGSLFDIYKGDQPGGIPGILPQPYYWWVAGGMFGGLIDYYYLTGDTDYVNVTSTAMLFQVGAYNDYMPSNQTQSEGNDDQVFWGIAAMMAAENNYPNPPPEQPQWLALAQAVFNTQSARWDMTTCNGGLRWQIYSFNNGYTYKNAPSNCGYFNMAARLGRYTGNTTYFEYAERSWNWMIGINMISSDFHMFDGSDDTINCTQMNHIEWTYSMGMMIQGTAMIWNATQNQTWMDRTNGLVKTATTVFFNNGIMTEVACESIGNCDIDQQTFKAYFSRWIGAAAKVAPFIADTVNPLLLSSAKAAISTCTGGAKGISCGLRWDIPFDGSVGIGETLSSLEVLQSLLQPTVPGPVSHATGGTSLGNAAAGGGGDRGPILYSEITGGDKAGAGILTTLILGVTFGGAYWIGR